MALTTLSSLRSNFIKHLAPYKSAANFSATRRYLRRLPPPHRFSSLPSVQPSHHRRQLRSNNFTVANCSTLQLNSNTSTADDESFTSPYLTVRILCRRHISDALSESLLCFGATSTTVDEQDGCGSDEEIWISSTFNVSQDVKDCISRAADSVGLEDIPSYEVEMCDHVDWIKQSQESFHPVEITDRVWVVPEWRTPPDVKAINIILNPGLAFGTGDHPTTRLCLLLLHRLIKGGESFLDYGTGSGILAIAALKFGADLSVGFDIEQQAITAARHNASLNGISPEKLLLSLVPRSDSPHISTQDSYDSKIIGEKDKYDVVIANILLYPLLDLSAQIVLYAKPGAVIGLSGIISEQVATVKEHYSEFLEDITVSMMDDWACISGKKRKTTTG